MQKPVDFITQIHPAFRSLRHEIAEQEIDVRQRARAAKVVGALAITSIVSGGAAVAFFSDVERQAVVRIIAEEEGVREAVSLTGATVISMTGVAGGAGLLWMGLETGALTMAVGRGKTPEQEATS